MGKAYSVAWLVVVDLSLLVMVVLYSRVVYTLWFKRDDNNQLTDQQKVSQIKNQHIVFLSLFFTWSF